MEIFVTGWLRKCMTDLADSFFDVFVIIKVNMKNNFRKIHLKSRKLGKQKYNSGIIGPQKKNELNNNKIKVLL